MSRRSHAFALLALPLAFSAYAQTPERLDQLTGDSLSAQAAMADGGKVVCGGYTTSMSILPAGLNLGGDFARASYIARFAANGAPLWIELLAASTATVGCTDLAVDSRQRIYATGSFTGAVAFSRDPGAAVLASNGGRDIFIVARDPDGRLRFAETIGGPENEASGGLAIKRNDSGLIATGSFRATVDFDPSAASSPLVSAGGNDAFLLEWNLAGDFQWAGALSGSGASAYLGDVLVDEAGDIYATGFADNGTDMDPGAGSAPLVTPGTIEQVLLKLNANRQFAWFRASLGQTVGTLSTGERVVKARDQLIVTGPFSGAVDFDPGLTSRIFDNPPAGAAFGAVAVSYASSGAFNWAQQVFASSGARMSAEGLSAGEDGGVSIGGRYSGSANFVPGQPGAQSLNATGNSDGYIARLNSRGTALRFASLGNANADEEAIRTVSRDALGRYTIGAEFQNTVDFDLGPGAAALTSLAGIDGALAIYYDDLIFSDGYQD